MEASSLAASGGNQLDHIHQGSSSEENVCTITIEEFSQLLSSQPRRWNNFSRPSRQIHRVPPQLRLKGQENERVFDPVMVSLGPYHHGKPELRKAEEFKYLCLNWCASGSEEKKVFFYNKIYEKIDEIRGCYAEVSSVEIYGDKQLALMMLLDACFILNYMENRTRTKRNNFLEWRNCLGVAAAIPFAARDIVLLENQIPFQVLKLLISLQYEKEEGEELLLRFLSWMLSLDFKLSRIPREDEEPLLHILEACWRVIAEQQNANLNRQQSVSSKFQWPRLMTRRKKKAENMPSLTLSYHTCRSVTDLKAKGIYITPSSSHSLKDIKFKSHALHGQLQLPVRYVSEITQVILSNMIAYEISPDTKTDLAVLSYTNFMKSLIESPADVKQLQEYGLLFNRFANHEQVVNVFKDIETFGLVNFDIFSDVKRRVEEHCSSKAKTWVANLIHTQFRNPWTVIGLLAATLLLCLTFLQTYFTIHPRN